ncbi:MAG: porin, partial [Pseudomonadales bacterium]|nr:porin [Pseudomonadales bacterium]
YDQWEVNSNASRLGVKGKEKISDNLSAIYKAEYQIDVDAGDDVFKQRNIYGGFKGGFGEVIVGKFDTPVKTSQKKVDLFNDYELGDIKNVLAGENRTSNNIQYTTPDMGGFKAKLAVMPGEGECDESKGDDCDDGLADGISASVAYDQDGIYVALAMDSEVTSKFGGFEGKTDIMRLVAQANIDMFQAGIIYQTAEPSDSDDGDAEQDALILSGSMKVGSDGKVKLQYGMSEIDEIEQETTQIALGYEHKLSKQTKVFTHYVNLEDDTDGTTDEESTIAFGMEHKF